MKYFYGPVPSRRLGFSLGVDIIPVKTCSFDCVYCQVGRTTRLTTRRRSFVNIGEFTRELRAIYARRPRIDYITIAGSGEPTLHKGLDSLIGIIKRETHHAYPVAVITNSSLLYQKQVRKELLSADLIIPSLDAATRKTFNKIDRPHASVRFEKILEGLIRLRQEFKGKLWLEIMMLAGFNDSVQEWRAFKPLIAALAPEKVQINLPVRPSGAKINLPPYKKILMFKKIIGPRAQIVPGFYKETKKQFSQSVQKDLVRMLSVRPTSYPDLLNCLGLERRELDRNLRLLSTEGRIRSKMHRGKKFYTIAAR